MSMLDQLRRLEQQLVSRLKKLEPLTREYEQLRKVAQRLGIKYSPGSAEAPAPARSSTPRRGGDHRRARSTGGKRATRTPAKTRATQSPAGARTAKTAAKTGATRSTAGERVTRNVGATRARGSAPTTSKPRRTGAAGQRSGGRRAARVRPGQRQEDVLRLVGETPGITVSEIGKRLGVDSTGLYRVVNRLSDQGRLRKDGPQLHRVEPAAPATLPESQAADATESEAPATAAAETSAADG